MGGLALLDRANIYSLFYSFISKYVSLDIKEWPTKLGWLQ